MEIPVIETERLILRAHRLGDLDALARMWGHPEVVRFIGGTPLTREESWARLLRYVGHWKLLGFGYWAVELKGEDRFVGDVGFANWQRDISPSLEDMPEAGWAFSPEVHGQGLATEAVQAALGWMDRHAGHPPTACLIGEGHAASVRVAHKCGYREFAHASHKGRPVILFRRQRERAGQV